MKEEDETKDTHLVANLFRFGAFLVTDFTVGIVGGLLDGVKDIRDARAAKHKAARRRSAKSKQQS